MWEVISITIFFTFILGCFTGLRLEQSSWEQLAEQCAKQNNVYACEWVAVPKLEKDK